MKIKALLIFSAIYLMSSSMKTKDAFISHSLTDTQFQLDTSFYRIQNEVFNRLSQHLYQTNIHIVQYPSQGEYAWKFENINGIFNDWTFNYISASLSNGDIPYTLKLSSSGGFPNGYSQILSSIYYELSTSDVLRINSTLLANQHNIDTLVSAFESTFYPITDKEIDQARIYCGEWVTNKIDYIIQFVLGGQWSGRIEEGKPPLSYSTIISSTDLTALLVDIPEKGVDILPLITNYINAVVSISNIEDKRSENSWMLNKIKSNVVCPTDSNGGIKLIDPVDGKISSGYQVAYSIKPSLAQISEKLSPSNLNVIIKINAEDSTNIEVRNYIYNDSTITDSIKYNLVFEEPIRLTDYDSSQPNTMEFRIYGVVMIESDRYNWSTSDYSGWFDKSIISGAIRNNGQDVSGFKFVSSPPFNLSSASEGGEFGFINKLFISQNYEVSFKYKEKTLHKSLTSGGRNASVTLENTALTAKINANSRSSDFEIQFTNAAGPVTVPDLQQKAYVLGVNSVFPNDY